MEILHQGIEDEFPGPGVARIMTSYDDLVSHILHIEEAGRTCYRSLRGKSVTRETAEKFIWNLIRRGHVSVLEHSSMSVKFLNISRGMTHELVRHRVGIGFSQESSRYVDYSKTGVEGDPGVNLAMVLPPHRDIEESVALDFPFGLRLKLGKASFEVEGETELPSIVSLSMLKGSIQISDMFKVVGEFYKALRRAGWAPEDARQILPIGLRTSIVVTANFREWRHIFSLRCDRHAHWEIRSVMCKLLAKLKGIIPEIFPDFQYQGVDEKGFPIFERLELGKL